MKKIKFNLKRILLIEVIILLPLLSFVWIYRTYQVHNKVLYKDRINLCLLNKKIPIKSHKYICSERMETFQLFMNPIKTLEAKKNVDREKFYWDCYDEEWEKSEHHGRLAEQRVSSLCSEQADSSIK